jgi:hypothetical protein
VQRSSNTACIAKLSIESEEEEEEEKEEEEEDNKEEKYDNGIAALAKEYLTENSYYPITNAL